MQGWKLRCRSISASVRHDPAGNKTQSTQRHPVEEVVTDVGPVAIVASATGTAGLNRCCQGSACVLERRERLPLPFLRKSSGMSRLFPIGTAR